MKPSELAPLSVLIFAEMAEEVGGTNKYLPYLYIVLIFQCTVPSGVLSVLPGYGKTIGKEIVSNPLIRKVDITVSGIAHISETPLTLFIGRYSNRPRARQHSRRKSGKLHCRAGWQGTNCRLQ